MLNSIREVYGLEKAGEGSLKTIMKESGTEVIADLVVDKVMGNIPLIGIPANVVCAKAMTWRLGILFGMLSSRGEEINEENVNKAVRVIRQAFPQKNPMFFSKPSVVVVEKLLTVVEGTTFNSFDQKMMSILDALA